MRRAHHQSPSVGQAAQEVANRSVPAGGSRSVVTGANEGKPNAHLTSSNREKPRPDADRVDGGEEAARKSPREDPTKEAPENRGSK